jgi:hypothetical protein
MWFRGFHCQSESVNMSVVNISRFSIIIAIIICRGINFREKIVSLHDGMIVWCYVIIIGIVLI